MTEKERWTYNMEEKISRQSDLKINKFMNEKQGEGIYKDGRK